MNGFKRMAAVGAAMAVISACGGSSDDGPKGDPVAFQASIQGTWAACQSNGSLSTSSTMVVSGLAVSGALRVYANGTCTGTPAAEETFAGTLHIGAAVFKALGSATVIAYQVDLTDSVGTSYDLGYVDTVAVPNRLYMGDSSGANDGSTPALRPTALDETLVHAKQ